jgi:archaellum component FlaC
MTKQEMLKALIEDLRLNHEYCPKEGILQAADELERIQQGIETLHAMYEQASRQRDELMDQQRAQVEAMRGRVQ